MEHSVTTVPQCWKRNWAKSRTRFRNWWAGKGLALNLGDFPGEVPHAATIDPGPSSGPQQTHTDPEWIAATNRHRLAGRNFELGDILPVAFVDWHTVAVAAYLGAEVELGPDTIWYHPVIEEPEDCAPPVFDPECRWFRIHEAIYKASAKAAAGTYMIGQPGIGSNIEVLAALRGSENLMMDFYDEPEWVKSMLWAINDAFFAAYGRIHEIIHQSDGSIANSYFAIWGEGKTTVITLDPIAMISPDMFEEFVLPPLKAQVDWLDHAIVHVDGKEALPHLDHLLGIENLQAIEWTPDPNVPAGGDPCWYDLYKRIKDAGKAVQAIMVKPEEVVPLVKAVGAEGMYITAYCDTAEQARELLEAVEPLRPRDDPPYL